MSGPAHIYINLNEYFEGELRVSVLGAGDVSKVSRFTLMSEDELSGLIGGIAKFLVGRGVEVVIIPNKGLPLEIAKKYKERGGKKVLGGLFQRKIKIMDWGI